MVENGRESSPVYGRAAPKAGTDNGIQLGFNRGMDAGVSGVAPPTKKFARSSSKEAFEMEIQMRLPSERSRFSVQ